MKRDEFLLYEYVIIKKKKKKTRKKKMEKHFSSSINYLCRTYKVGEM